MKKKTWKLFCIFSLVLFIQSIYITIFTYATQGAFISFLASITLFVVPTLICLNEKSRIKYGIVYIFAVGVFVISDRKLTRGVIDTTIETILYTLWFISFISLLFTTIYLIADINKGEKN